MLGWCLNSLQCALEPEGCSMHVLAGMVANFLSDQVCEPSCRCADGKPRSKSRGPFRVLIIPCLPKGTLGYQRRDELANRSLVR
jgi:hypothetical protein